MQYILLLLISVNSFAGGFAPIEKIGFDEKTYPKFHESESQCVETEGQPCYDIDACPLYKCNLIDEEINDKPIYGERQNVTACSDELACEELRPTLCPDSFFFYAMNANNGFEAYCTKIIGYTKVKTGKKLLIEDAQKLKAHLKKIQDEKDAKDAQKLAKDALKEKLKALKKSDLGTVSKNADALIEMIELLIKE